MIRPMILMALGLSKYIEVLEVPYDSPYDSDGSEPF